MCVYAYACIHLIQGAPDTLSEDYKGGGGGSVETLRLYPEIFLHFEIKYWFGEKELTVFGKPTE